ncbi:MAG TPA: carboxypeptidase regulatory-like domain-containing protein [Candidatus Acidoferrales bacterium]|nr:carboxypeptidase regulatory-like domain-containing protein [Candidatus Acidoferrales bacterium]
MIGPLPGLLLGLLLLLMAPARLAACKCEMTFSACAEAAQTEVVFIGTVESVEPSFLDHWNPAQRSSLAALNEETTRLRADKSPAGVVKLKDTYLKVFPDLPEDYRKQLAAANTTDDLVSAFYWILGHGKRARVKVKTVYRGDDDDEYFTIWTPFGDCGYDFQKGETYLIYADQDEETDIMETGVCNRTRRVSDAGEDLAYLFFLQHGKPHSTRLEGFVTSNLLYQAEHDTQHYTGAIKSPVSSAVLELRSAEGPRYTESDAGGRFVFDGLAAGVYNVTVFAPGYPREVQILAGPRQVRVEANACATQIFVVP